MRENNKVFATLKTSKVAALQPLRESAGGEKGVCTLVCVCDSVITNYALAYKYKFWTFVLPCGNVKAHYKENVPRPICSTMNRKLTNKIRSEEVQEKNKQKSQPLPKQPHELKYQTKTKRSRQAKASKRQIKPQRWQAFYHPWRTKDSIME